MWIIAKYDKNKLNFFLRELKKNLKDDLKIYNPIMRLEKFNKKKIITKNFYVLNDYIFCFSKKFLSQRFLNNLKFTKGLKYFLPNALQHQHDIIEFIERCQKIEDFEGYINQSLFETHINKDYKFISGPFMNQIFKTINFQKNKIEIMLGGIKTTFNKKELQYTPV